jgi:hypothetical protein
MRQFVIIAAVASLLDAIDWRKAAAAYKKLRDLDPEAPDHDMLNIVADEIAADLDDAVDWADIVPGMLGDGIELADKVLFKTAVRIAVRLRLRHGEGRPRSRLLARLRRRARIEDE